MQKKTVMLLTGAGGDAQGWGAMPVTEAMRSTICGLEYGCVIAEAETPSEMYKALKNVKPDVVWSALYYFTDREDLIGMPSDAVWTADELDKLGVPYIGSSSGAMKKMIMKYATHETLAANGVPVPAHFLCPPDSSLPDGVPFPAFVKPNGESRSKGISDESVVRNEAELSARVKYIWRELGESALIEEYLPGREFTVMVVGDGASREILPGEVTVDAAHYGKYRILRSDLRGVGLTKISIPDVHFDEAVNLARAATDAIDCRDHIRIDMREGADGRLRIMEANGIPGMKPLKSWSPQIYALYHPSDDPYSALVGAILSSAFARIK